MSVSRKAQADSGATGNPAIGHPPGKHAETGTAWAVILPPSPGFYTHPASVDDMVDFVVARILDQLRIPTYLMPRWGEPAKE
jgi:hypothetical protein